MFDIIPSDITEANRIADMIENLICDISDIEQSCNLSEDQDYYKFKPDDESTLTRMQRYKSAYASALQTNNQGFVSSSVQSLTKGKQRSWEEINAISMAAFATSENISLDSYYRLHCT